MIFHDRKIIFIHIPKTAGSSINKFFFNEQLDWKVPNYDILYGWCPKRKIHLQHARPEELLRTGLITPEQWNTYFKFAFVRNPWDRAYSDYLWIKEDQNVYGSFIEYLTKSGNFSKVLSDRSNKLYRGDHLFTQTSYLNTVGQKGLDFIGRFENLNHDISLICGKLNVDLKFDLHEKKNTDKKSHYSLFYTKTKKELVEEIFRKDIDLLGYSFDDKKKGFDKIRSWF